MENMSKVDVPLTWLDFLWSLEQLCHKKQYTASQNRDWFKLNPLELTLLGCETITKKQKVTSKLSTIVVSMENITPYILSKPRILQWLLNFLLDILSTPNVSSFLAQRTRKLLVDMYWTTKNFRFHYWTKTIIVDIIEHDPLKKKTLESFGDGVVLLNHLGEALQVAEMDEEVEMLHHSLNSINAFNLKAIINEHSFKLVQKLWGSFYLKELIEIVKEISSNPTDCTSKFLLLIELIINAYEKSESSFTQSTSTDSSKEISHVVDETNQTETVTIDASCSYNTFFQDIHAFLEKCKSIFHVRTDVPNAFFVYLNAELASACSPKPITLSDLNLNVVMDFFMDYSTKGVKGKSSEKIMCGLLELVTSSVETDIPRMVMLNIYLPNILSIGFDNMTEDIACLLLQYGSLACRSKFNTELLSKALWFIKSLCGIFPSVQEKQDVDCAISRRIESLTIVKNLLLEVVNSVTHGHTKSDSTTNSLLPLKNIEQFPKDSDEDDFREVELVENLFRPTLMKLLLELACSMIKTGENINYTYVSVLPRLFYRTDFPLVPQDLPLAYFPSCVNKISTLPWRVSKERLAVKVLQLCIECLAGSICTPFQICGVMIPKLAKNLDMTGLNDTVKMDILCEFIQICHSKLSTSQHIETLISHGIDVMSLLMPTNKEEVDVKAFIHNMTASLEKFGNSSSMLLLKSSCEFMLTNFKDETEEVKILFTYLIKKYNRNGIRNVFLLSKTWFSHDQYAPCRRALYDYSVSKFKSKQLQAMTEILTSITAFQKTVIKTSNSTDETEQLIIAYLTTEPLIRELTSCIQDNRFNIERQEDMKSKLNRLFLYHVLFQDKIEELFHNTGSIGCMREIEREIPEDILADSMLMTKLQTSAKRIEHMQVPRYQSLKSFVINLLKGFVVTPGNVAQTGEVSDNMRQNEETNGLVHETGDIAVNITGNPPQERKSSGEDLKLILAERVGVLARDLASLPWNVSKREKLISSGYSSLLWCEKISIKVETNGQLNLEENLRQTLLSCFTEYCELLRQLGIPSVLVDGSQLKVEDIFTEEYPLTELKGRRAIVVKVIDKNASVNNQTRIMERKSALLVQEENIEQKIEKTSRLPLKSCSYTAELNVSFFDCVDCCGPQIVGCYSPVSGEHCERPLEIGFRADSAFASIYNEGGVEMENCELFFTDQGVYVYKAYSSGHPYDTADVWLALFIELLETKEFVPAIILPYHFPNRTTWEAFRRWVSPEITGTVLTCDFDFSSEWRSYYDSRPECVGYGKDIILTKGFQNTERRRSFSYHRQLSLNTNKDFASMLFDFAMEAILERNDLKIYRFLGKHIALFLNDLVNTGTSHPDLISNNFDFDRWKKGQKWKVDKSKQDIVESLVNFILDNVSIFISTMDFNVLFKTRLKQFLQLRSFLEKNLKSNSFSYTMRKLTETTKIIISHLQLVKIGDFEEAFQEELMHWIFDNEDRVWRYRGGSDGHETLTQYLGFLSHKRQNRRCFPGVVVCLRKEAEFNTEIIQVKNIVGYAVGEYVDRIADLDEVEIPTGESVEMQVGKNGVNESYYEIVTAWVNPRFRVLQLSTSLYMRIFQSVTSDNIYFDMLNNSVEKVIKTSFGFNLLHKIGLSKFFILDQSLSYNVATVTATEQFEKFVVKRKPVAMCIWAVEFFKRNHLFILGLFIVFLAVFCGWCLA